MRFEEIFREMPFVAFLPMSGCQCTQGCHECVPLRGFMGVRRTIEAPIKLRFFLLLLPAAEAFFWFRNHCNWPEAHSAQSTFPRGIQSAEENFSARKMDGDFVFLICHSECCSWVINNCHSIAIEYPGIISVADSALALKQRDGRPRPSRILFPTTNRDAMAEPRSFGRSVRWREIFDGQGCPSYVLLICTYRALGVLR